jgi:hypothetical protein
MYGLPAPRAGLLGQDLPPVGRMRAYRAEGEGENAE